MLLKRFARTTWQILKILLKVIRIHIVCWLKSCLQPELLCFLCWNWISASPLAVKYRISWTDSHVSVKIIKLLGPQMFLCLCVMNLWIAPLLYICKSSAVHWSLPEPGMQCSGAQRKNSSRVRVSMTALYITAWCSLLKQMLSEVQEQKSAFSGSISGFKQSHSSCR